MSEEKEYEVTMTYKCVSSVFARNKKEAVEMAKEEGFEPLPWTARYRVNEVNNTEDRKAPR